MLFWLPPLPAMDNNESPPSVAPPVYTKADPHQDTLPPYRKNDEEPLAARPQQLGDEGGEEGIANAPKEEAVKERSRKKRFWIVGSLLLLAVVIAATASSGYYARKASGIDDKDEDPRKTGPQPESRGPPVVALADNTNRRMGSCNERGCLWHVSTDGKLARHRAGNAPWIITESKRFLTAPVSSMAVRLATALEASTGALLVCSYGENYEWFGDCAWVSLGGRFTNPPTAVFRERKGEVHAVAENGQLWRRRLKEWTSEKRGWRSRPTWFDWDLVGDGFAGELSTFVVEDFYDPILRVAAVRSGTYQVLRTAPDEESWPAAWENYGRPPLCDEALGSPKLFSVSQDYTGVLVACNGKLWYRIVSETRDPEWNLFEAPGGENLTHSIDTQNLFGENIWTRPDLWYISTITPYLVSRTDDHCYYSTAISLGNETTGGGEGGVRGAPWQQLWCQTEEQKSLATNIMCDREMDDCTMYREDANGRTLQATSQPFTMVDGNWTTSTTELTWAYREGPAPWQ